MTSPEQSAVASAAVRPYRWVMLLLLWSLYASFGVTVASIAPLATTILDDLDMTYSQMGLILGAWQLVYVGTAFPLGALVDRLGPRRSLGIGIFIIWLSLVLRGLAVAVTSGARFVYSADSAPCPSLMELARDADLFLCETTFLGDEPNLVPGVHFTAEEVGAFARDANVRQLSVTHVLPGTSRERISALASRDFGAPVPVVEEHQVLHL